MDRPRRSLEALGCAESGKLFLKNLFKRNTSNHGRPHAQTAIIKKNGKEERRWRRWSRLFQEEKEVEKPDIRKFENVGQRKRFANVPPCGCIASPSCSCSARLSVGAGVPISAEDHLLLILLAIMQFRNPTAGHFV